jgi:trimeric autotransporter adhesin
VTGRWSVVNVQRNLVAGGLARAGSALVAGVLVVGVLAGGGPAAAAAPTGGVGAAWPALAGPGVISTVAGGVGGPARATRVNVGDVGGVWFAGGFVYLGAGAAIWKVNPATDWMTTLAGTGEPGPLGLGRLAAQADLGAAYWETVDHSGNLVFSDPNVNRVLVVAASTGTFYGQPMRARHLYSVAGDGHAGYSGDGGPATAAELNLPDAVAVDSAGNLVITDNTNNRIRVVAESSGTFYGQAMTAGDIYTVAGDGTFGYNGDGIPATSAELASPNGMSVDSAGNLLIGDTDNYRLRVVAASTGTFYGQAMTAGDIYTVAGDGSYGFSGDGGPATSAELTDLDGVVADSAGNLLIADANNERVRVVAEHTGTFYGQAMTAGDIYTIAGDGTRGYSGDGIPATSAELDNPVDVATDSAGNVLIADMFNNRVRVIAASTGTFYGQAMTAGDIYTVAGDGSKDYVGNGVPATSAQLDQPLGVAVDGAGNWVITDGYNNRVRVIAASTGTFYGQAMTAGHIYTIAGNGKEGFSGDGGPATATALSGPNLVALDGAGNVVIADQGNERIRVVAEATGTFYGQAMTAGDIYTVAGGGSSDPGDGGPATSAVLNAPAGVTVDAAGNLVLTDTNDNRVEVVAEHTGTFYGQAMTAGDIYDIAGNGTAGYSGDGGPATAAMLYHPNGVLVDGAGNVVITDINNNRIRVIAESTGTFYGQAMTAGDIYTIAGDGTQGFSGDGGPATAAELNGPNGVALDGAGNVVIADTFNNRVRVVAESTGTFYGQAMTAGDIYTIAGTGKAGFSGDGGPATKAEFDDINEVAVDGGNLLIADRLNNRVRMVTG